MQRAPNGLGTSGRRFWRNVLSHYELSPGELLILEEACRCADRLTKMNFLCQNTQPMVKGSRDNLRPNPVFRLANETARELDNLVRSLALPFPGESEGKKRSPQQQEAAQARWRAVHDERDRVRGQMA